MNKFLIYIIISGDWMANVWRRASTFNKLSSSHLKQPTLLLSPLAGICRTILPDLIPRTFYIVHSLWQGIYFGDSFHFSFMKALFHFLLLKRDGYDLVALERRSSRYSFHRKSEHKFCLCLCPCLVIINLWPRFMEAGFWEVGSSLSRKFAHL